MPGTANGAGDSYDLTPEANRDPWLVLLGWADLEVEAMLRGRIEADPRLAFETLR
jgi:hypothetical protein